MKEESTHQRQEGFTEKKIGVHHLLLGGNDQKVIEKVDVDADKRHPCAVSGVDGQLSHRTLVHQEAPADHQGNRLRGEAAAEERYCHLQVRQQRFLCVADTS